MGFEFSGLQAPPHETEFKPQDDMPDGTGVKIWVNLDFMTADRIDGINNDIEERVKEILPVMPDEEDSEEVEPVKRKKSSKNKAGGVPGGEREVVGALVPSKPAIDSVFFMKKEHLRLRATILGGKPGVDDPTKRLIHSWNVVKDGIPVPVSFETFFSMPEHMQQKIYDFCMNEAPKPTKKK